MNTTAVLITELDTGAYAVWLSVGNITSSSLDPIVVILFY